MRSKKRDKKQKRREGKKKRLCASGASFVVSRRLPARNCSQLFFCFKTSHPTPPHPSQLQRMIVEKIAVDFGGVGWGGKFCGEFLALFFLVSVAKIHGNAAPIFLLLVEPTVFVPEGCTRKEHSFYKKPVTASPQTEKSKCLTQKRATEHHHPRAPPHRKKSEEVLCGRKQHLGTWTPG